MEKELRLISASEAAIKLGVHHKTVSRLMRKGKLKSIKIANRWLIEESVVEEFAENYMGKKGRSKGWSPKKEVGR